MNDQIALLDELLADPEYQKLEREATGERLKLLYSALVEVRKNHIDFMTRAVVTVLVPECESCYSFEHRASDSDDGDWKPPDIDAATWKRDLSSFGATRAEIRRIARDPEFLLDCSKCQNSMTYGTDNIYIIREPFECYFPDFTPEDHEVQKRSAPRWMKKLVFDVYRGRCFGCKKKLTWDEKSTDHIVPYSVGGLSELSNLQLLCRRCNGKMKKDKIPAEERFDLYFLILPADRRYRASRLW